METKGKDMPILLASGDSNFHLETARKTKASERDDDSESLAKRRKEDQNTDQELELDLESDPDARLKGAWTILPCSSSKKQRKPYIEQR